MADPLACRDLIEAHFVPAARAICYDLGNIRRETVGIRSTRNSVERGGLDSRDYSEKALAEQAAGVAYAWAKIAPLKSITAFQYHIWADNRGEGGLRLGLRKFGDDPQDPLGKKPAWDVYQAAGTDQWERSTAFAKLIIGIKDWREVHFTGTIR
jgi:hypothetical protein